MSTADAMMTEKDTITQDTLPDTQTLTAIGDLNVLDESGKAVPFKTLYTGDATNSRQLIIFIRHYYCGQCEEYVKEIASRHTPAKLAALSPPTELIIVGCGSPEIVSDYKKRTQCNYRIYSDPTRQLYFKLGFVENIGMGDKKPTYLKTSTFQSVVNSAWTALTAGPKLFNAGNFSQNGGEMLFENGQLKWLHRMKNTRDHAELSEIEERLHIS